MHQKSRGHRLIRSADRWYGPDKHYWFRTTITIPESFDGKNLWMRVHAGLDDWDGRNPQFLLFANGEVIQGMDINHREVLVRENAKAGEKIRPGLVCRLERCTAGSV